MLLGVLMLCAVKLSCKLSIQVFAYLPLHRSLWVGATTPSTCSIRSLEAAYQTRYSNRPSCRRRIWQKMNACFRANVKVIVAETIHGLNLRIFHEDNLPVIT